jgi:hypothetical protein
VNRRTIITLALGVVLILTNTACQRNEAPHSGPSPILASDTDLGHGYVRRDGTIHFIGGGITGTGANATRIDTPSRGLVKKVQLSEFGSFKTAEGLDAASFEALSEEYTRDKSRVYFKVISQGEFIVILLPEADAASFEVLSENLARDKSRVWYRNYIQSGADPATLEVVDHRASVFKDRDSVHYQDTKLRGAEPASFKHLGSGYYADRIRVYWCTDPIPDADPATFKVLGDSFVAKDKSRAYRSGEPLHGLDAPSLELILHNEAGYQIYSDKNGIHVNQMTFPRSKAGSAEIIDDRTVRVGDLIHLVEHSRNTPATLFKEDGKLMAESPAYDPMTRKENGIISAEVTPEGLKNIRIHPLPGSGVRPRVPDWQMEVFKHMHPIGHLIELGRKIK